MDLRDLAGQDVCVESELPVLEDERLTCLIEHGRQLEIGGELTVDGGDGAIELGLSGRFAAVPAAEGQRRHTREDRDGASEHSHGDMVRQRASSEAFVYKRCIINA